eukprot:TRINITY_DN62170_c0_g2_i1.p1 TRINITY_DN62170_c0_g2~~TRINITY_DN62170_c0_g2_i1.p1  ORF type:complete len:447 (+),score=89.60 TRINITY_DN62170_c0_g2_i1:56-1342(+)
MAAAQYLLAEPNVDHGTNDVVLGVLICVFGSTLTALGVVLQKYSHFRQAARAKSQKGVLPYFLQPLWICGFAVFIAAQAINVFALALAPMMVISCLGSWSLVCNAIFAHVLLGETLAREQQLAVVGLVAAVLVVSSNAPAPQQQSAVALGDIRRLTAMFLRPGFEVLTVVLVGIIMLLRLAVRWTQSRACKCFCSRPRLLAVEEDDSKQSLDAPEDRSCEKALGPFSFTAASAVLAGYTALLFKCVAQICLAAFAEESGAAADSSPREGARGHHSVVVSLASFPHHVSTFEVDAAAWQTYAIVGLALFLAPLQVHLLNLALLHGSAVTVVPTYFALGMIAQLLTGAVFFQELRDFRSASAATAFGAGVVLALLFVVLMAKAGASQAEEAAKISSPKDTSQEQGAYARLEQGFPSAPATALEQPLLSQA